MHRSAFALGAAFAAALLTGLAGCQSTQPPLPTPQAADPDPVAAPALPMNGVLAEPTGRTLYTFDKDADTPGHSACVDACATHWPPYLAPAGARPTGAFTIITRDDGSRQWAYRDRPLYTYANDLRAGETQGDGFKGVWHVARP